MAAISFNRFDKTERQLTSWRTGINRSISRITNCEVVFENLEFVSGRALKTELVGEFEFLTHKLMFASVLIAVCF